MDTEAPPGGDDDPGRRMDAIARLEAYRDARADLHDAVRAAHAAGVPRVAIARASGLSRQWVINILSKTSDHEPTT